MSSLFKPIVLVLCCMLTAGCAELQRIAAEHPIIATLGCAGIGAGAAVGTGRVAWGVGLATLCEAAVLVNMTNYQANQVRSPAQDQQIYGLTEPINSPVVKIHSASTSPGQVKPGDTLHVVTDYSVRAPKGTQEVAVVERLIVKKDGKVVKDLGSRTRPRVIGGWNAKGDIPIPQSMPAGTYVLEHHVESGTSNDVQQTSFVVAA